MSRQFVEDYRRGCRGLVDVDARAAAVIIIHRQARGWEEGPDLLQSAWLYKWLIAVAALLGMLLGCGWAARQPTLHAAASQVLLTGTPSLPLSEDAPPIRSATPIDTSGTSHPSARHPSWSSRRRRPRRGDGRGPARGHDRRGGAGQRPDDHQHSGRECEQGGDARQRDRRGIGELRRGTASRAASQLRTKRAQLEARLDQVNEELAAAPNDTSLQRRAKALNDELTRLKETLVQVEGSVGTNLVNVAVVWSTRGPAAKRRRPWT